ncbi:MAG TPA: DUF6263 family protein [Kofleriaceae bacterium]|nr:DUF6263 family protein [Kofleriaceae bacterium]
MHRLSLLLLVAAACGGSSKPAPTTPIPDDTKTAAAPAPAPTPPPAPPAAPPPPKPVDVTIPAQQTTVKLVSAGKGKKEAIHYALKEGTKQAVELALDFSGKQDADEQTVPTIVLAADAETKAVKDGTAEYTLTVTGVDARSNPGAANVPLDKFRQVLDVLVGLQVNGTVGASGTAGDVVLHMDKGPRGIEKALELIRVTLPRVPALPTEAVGVGAKWQTTSAAKLADRLDVTQTTDYELVAHKGTTWTIKGTTKVVGKEQSVETAKVTDIAGTGTTEATIDSSQFYPTVKSTLETQFTATDKDKSAKYSIKVGSAVTPKDAAAPAKPDKK